MGVTRVAVDAAKFAPTIRIDRPPKRHPRTGAPIKNLLDRHLDELDAADVRCGWRGYRRNWQRNCRFHRAIISPSIRPVKDRHSSSPKLERAPAAAHTSGVTTEGRAEPPN